MCNAWTDASDADAVASLAADIVVAAAGGAAAAAKLATTGDWL